QLSGVTWRVKIEKKMLLEILKRLSMEKYDLDSEWIKALELVGTLYENYQRDRALDEGRNPSRKESLKRKSADEDRKFDKKKRKEPNANQQRMGQPPITLASQGGRQVRAVERPELVWDDLSDRENTLARRN